MRSRPIAAAASLRSAAMGPLLARATSLVLSAAASVAFAKILAGAIGTSAYGLTGLFIAATWSLPVLVNGSGTIIVNTIAGMPVGEPIPPDSAASSRLHRAARVQVQVGAGVMVVAIAVAIALWLFGDDPTWGTLALSVGICLGVMVLVSPGAAVMQAVGRQAILSLLPAVTGALSLPLLLLLLAIGLGPVAAVAGPAAGALVHLCVYGWTIHRWALPIPSARAIREPRPRGGSSLARAATAFTAVSTVYFMSDRYLLSGAGAEFIAVFAVLQQLAVPLMALTGSVGDGLWAYFETQKAQGADQLRLRTRILGASGAVGIGLGLVAAIAGTRFVAFVLGATSVEPSRIALALGVLIAASGLYHGSIALLRTTRGLRLLTLVWAGALALKVAVTLLAVSHGRPEAGVLAGVCVYLAAVTITLMLGLRLRRC